ncbi:MAG: sugar ABC transporter permease [Bifidobacteriaceae bacterium]|nr:sugar ABC transporter permease [Bifidobacteriaceae bacterium]
MSTPNTHATPPRAAAPPAPPRSVGQGRSVRPRPWTKRRVFNTVTPWLFLLLPLGLLALLTYLPAANLVYYSFTDWDGIDKTKEIIGPGNYARMFTDPEMYRVLLVSLYYLVGALVQMAIALYFATILSFKMRLQNFFKGMIFFPYLLNGVAVGYVFLYLFREGGTLDVTLAFLGLEDLTQQWLGDPKLVNVSLAATSVWRYTGMNFVLFLGAIQSIPSELYEAAELDGANRWHQFWHIILPGIRRVFALSCILAISGALAVFEIPFVMTGGGNGSKSFVIQTVSMAFMHRKVGLAAAMALVLLVIVLLVTWIQRKVLPDERVDLA